MSDQPLIERLVAELGRHLPAGLEQWRGELERSARAVLQEGISRLDLISREEFDIQQQVLARTREKLEALEQDVAALEQRLQP